MFVENCLAVLELTQYLDRTNLATSDARVTRILSHTELTFYPACFRTGDMASNTLDFWVVETVDNDLVIGA